MGIKEFLKPDWRKIVIYIFLFVSFILGFMSYFCFAHPMSVPIPPYCDNPIFNPNNPIINIVGTIGLLVIIPISFVLAQPISGEFFIILSLIETYVISCLIVWIYDKYFKKVKKKK